MATTGTRDPDPIAVLERLDTFLAHVEACHAAGLAWGGVTVDIDRLTRVPDHPVDPRIELGPPRLLSRLGERADVNMLRRVLAVVAADLRYARDDRETAHGVADGLCLARGAASVRAMRARLRGEILLRLRHLRRDVGRRIDASGTVDIRLDAWAQVGQLARAGIRQYLDGVLEQQADYATFGRARLGRYVDRRRRLDLAIERVEALDLDLSPEPQRALADSGPIEVSAFTRPTAPDARPGHMRRESAL